MTDRQKIQTDTTNIDRKCRTQKGRKIRQNRKYKQTIEGDLEVRICASLYVTIKNKMDDFL